MKTLKTLAILCLGTLLFNSCNNEGGEAESNLVLMADKYDLYDDPSSENGVATLTLTYNGKVVTDIDKVDFTNENNKYASNLITYGEDGVFTFSSTEKKIFCFTAHYGTMKSNQIRISVTQTPPEAPAAPVDPNPGKTNFKRRVLLTQFTGTGCPNCPYMINALHTLKKTSLAESVVFTAAHLYNEGDPAYLYKAPALSDALGVYSYPWIIADMKRTSSYTGELKNCEPFYAYVQKLVQHSIERVEVKGGIAVNCEYRPEEGFVMATALVKAKQSAEFRIGAWLVEDGIYGKQQTKGIAAEAGVDFDTHNNCIRVANSRRASNDYTGFQLEKINTGETATKAFALPLLPHGEEGGENYWNHDNLRLIVFIATKENGSWYVNNVIEAPINGVTDFVYNE